MSTRDDHPAGTRAAVTGGDRRALIAEAAADLIAEQGIRALTHRALDNALRLPAGSTSYYFRTRRDLVAAVADTITARSRADFEDARFPPPAATDPHALARGIAAWVDRLLRERRNHLVARQALIIESATDEDLRRRLAGGLFSRERATELFAALGSDDPRADAADFVALLEGLVFDHLVGARSTPADGADRIARLTRPIHRFLAA